MLNNALKVLRILSFNQKFYVSLANAKGISANTFSSNNKSSKICNFLSYLSQHLSEIKGV